MKKIRLLTTAAAIALFASMILTGCGGGGKAADTGGSSAVQQSSGDSGEKMLKVATHWEKATFDPALWGDGGSVKAGISIFETLLALDEDRNLIPSLAESWDVSDDRKT